MALLAGATRGLSLLWGRLSPPVQTLPLASRAGTVPAGLGLRVAATYLQAAEGQRDAVLAQLLQQLCQPRHHRVIDAADAVAVQDDGAR